MRRTADGTDVISSGADHYREAERLLDIYTGRMAVIGEAMTARADRDGGGPSSRVRQDIGLAKMLLNEAQVHATLAQAAAGAYPAVKDHVGDEGSDSRDWTNATAPARQAVSA